jgi:hypothetical protein
LRCHLRTIGSGVFSSSVRSTCTRRRGSSHSTQKA